MKIILFAMFIMYMSGCSTTLNVAIDPASIKDRIKYNNDYDTCRQVAQTYDLSSDTTKNTLLGAAAGGAAVAGIATAIAGAVFLPAVPFILAGGAAGGAASGGLTKSKETAAREKIMADCMTQRGYKAFSG